MPIKFEKVDYTYLPNTVFKTEALKDINIEFLMVILLRLSVILVAEVNFSSAY